MRHTQARGTILTLSLILLLSFAGCGQSAAPHATGEAGQTPVFEPFQCEIVDANSGELIPGRDLTIHFMFKKPAQAGSPEEIISNLIWGSKSPARIQFLVPDEVLQHPDRASLVVEWGVSHPDYEPLAPKEKVRVEQILRDDPKSARDTFRRIKLSKRAGSPP